MSVDRRRLAHLLGMMGLQHDGEALNAARLASRLVKDAGASWIEVLDAPVYRPPACREDVFDLCHDFQHVLTPWERSFVVSVANRTSLTNKQTAVINRILAKIRCAAGFDARGGR